MTGLIGAVVKFVLWLWQRCVTKRDQPNARFERAKDENSKIVVNGDAAAVNDKLDKLTGRI